MLTLTQAVSRVASRLNKSASDTVVYNRLKNHINDVCQEKWHGYAWSFRFREYPMVTTAMVNSGTMTATNGSRTVTASGTPFDSTVHVGAFIRFTADAVDAVYRIQTVTSTSVVTIEPAYQGTTGGSKAYELHKVDYPLATELTDLGSISLRSGGSWLRPEHQMTTEAYSTPVLSIGNLSHVSIFNDEVIQSTYTTGTVSGTSGTATLTGVATAWLSNVKEGDSLTITGDTSTYTVYKVNSDTSLTLYNYLVSSPSGAAHIVSRQFGKVVRVHPSPDRAYVMFAKGLRAYAPLVATTDSNELLSRYPTAVIEGAVWREASSSPDPREDSLFQKSELFWATAMSQDEALFPQINRNPIWNARQR